VHFQAAPGWCAASTGRTFVDFVNAQLTGTKVITPAGRARSRRVELVKK
jgi:hypothetical protein